jgi:hypothetical protein
MVNAVDPMVRLLGGLLASVTLSVAGSALAAGWELEKGVASPSYAVAEPTNTDLNVDTVVLSCEQGPHRRGLQLRLYLSDAGPLAPVGVKELKADPTLQLAVDGKNHPAEVLFADDFVLVADTADGAMPLLSDRLLDALQKGRRLELRFDFQQKAQGRLPSFDGTAVVDLQPSAVAAVRRCADGGDSSRQVAETPRGR